jgi:hypothetical protein
VKRWKPAVDYHVGFKWLWLNRGRTESPVDIQVIFDPLFADQRFAAEHPNEISICRMMNLFDPNLHSRAVFLHGYCFHLPVTVALLFNCCRL